MTCRGIERDYRCLGWIKLRDRIRRRDGERCRLCNHGESEAVILQVHHRVYGEPGVCGVCVLTGVSDDDLLTLCKGCHDKVTSARREARYANAEEIPMPLIKPRKQPAMLIKAKLEIPLQLIEPKPKPIAVANVSIFKIPGVE